jgi:photosystem II stability/assembly factor-like uncharacterized protein
MTATITPGMALPHRRFAVAWVVFGILVPVFLVGFTWHAAFAETGIRALDESAIAAKAPDKTFLVAIARAGNRLVAVGEHGVIIYSDDNGKSWKQARVPVTVTFTDVAFADAMHGWAVGHYGVVLKTDDGGATWRLQLQGLQINQLTMQAAQRAVLDKSTAAGAPLVMRRANAFVAAGADKPLLSILVKNQNDVTIFGSYRIVLKTTDGGQSWTDRDLSIDDSLSHNLYDATASGNDIFVVGEAGFVFESTDGGNSFPATMSPNSVTLFGVVAANNASLVAFGVAGNAFRSDDGGKTWQVLTLGTGANLTAGLKLKSGAIVIAGQDGRLFISSDNGLNFRQMVASVPMSVAGMAQAANGALVVAGNGGTFSIPPSEI